MKKREKIRVELGYQHGVEVLYLEGKEFVELMMELFPEQPAPGAALDEDEQWINAHLANTN